MISIWIGWLLIIMMVGVFCALIAVHFAKEKSKAEYFEEEKMEEGEEDTSS